MLILVFESVYSMSGSMAPIKKFIDLAKSIMLKLSLMKCTRSDCTEKEEPEWLNKKILWIRLTL